MRLKATKISSMHEKLYRYAGSFVLRSAIFANAHYNDKLTKVLIDCVNILNWIKNIGTSMFSSNCQTLKKVSLLTIGIFAPTFANAGGDGRFDGYYAGVMGGVLETNANMSVSALAQYTPFFANNALATLTQDLVKTYRYKGMGEVYLGYGDFFYDSNYYWAIEIFGRIGTSKNTLNNTAIDNQDTNLLLSNSTSMRLKNFEYGADFLPGYLFDKNSLIYGRIGVAFNELTIENNTNFAFQSGPNNTATIINGAKSRESAFLRLGIGLEHKVCSNMSLTADYIYTYYGKLNTSSVGRTLSGEDGTAFNANGLTGSASGRFNTNAFMLGIRYFIFQ